jgi:hypothetical protein
MKKRVQVEIVHMRFDVNAPPVVANGMHVLLGNEYWTYVTVPPR